MVAGDDAVAAADADGGVEDYDDDEREHYAVAVDVAVDDGVTLIDFDDGNCRNNFAIYILMPIAVRLDPIHAIS